MDKPDLKPFKIYGQLIGVRHNDAEEIIAEESMGEVCIYRSQFGEVEKLIDDAVRKERES